MDWQDEYKRKLVSVEEAMRVVRPGDSVMVPIASPRILPPALAKRLAELHDIKLRVCGPSLETGLLGPELQKALDLEFEIFIGDPARFTMDEHRASYLPNTFSLQFKPFEQRPEEWRAIDILVVNVSPPNKQGYVSFGPHQWNKKSYMRRSRTVIAEVDDSIIRVHGDNMAHVSQFDYFIEASSPKLSRDDIKRQLEGVEQPRRAELEAIIDQASVQRLAPMFNLIAKMEPMALRNALGLTEPPEHARAISGYLEELVPDGATIQIGYGDPSGYMVRLGVFNNKVDLGLHSELVMPGIARLVDCGVINGKRKSIHKGVAVAAAWSGADDEELAIIDDNPKFHIYEPEYVLNPMTVAANDNQIAINNAIAVDLTGQINAESVFGPRMINGTGGLPEAHIGALYSKGGRAITLLPSTALGGSVSRIVGMMEAGSLVTIPRYFADTVITEYGVARLMGKNHRQRAEELIAIAHPDFRGELRRQAQKLFYP